MATAGEAARLLMFLFLRELSGPPGDHPLRSGVVFPFSAHGGTNHERMLGLLFFPASLAAVIASSHLFIQALFSSFLQLTKG